MTIESLLDHWDVDIKTNDDLTSGGDRYKTTAGLIDHIEFNKVTIERGAARST